MLQFMSQSLAPTSIQSSLQRYRLFAWLALTNLLCLLLASSLGDLKGLARVDLIDLLGEGSSLLIILMVLTLVLSARPSGRVTQLIFIGGLLLTASMSLDVLDEFFAYPEELRLMSWLESLPMPLGFVVIGLAAINWFRESQIIQRQLHLREHHLREHNWLDPLTLLYTRPYFQVALQRELALAELQRHPLCLVELNIVGFARLNHQYGAARGDLILRELADLLLLFSRPQDTVCRDNNDRFMLILPHFNTTAAQRWLDTTLPHLHRELNKSLPLLKVQLAAKVIPQAAAAKLSITNEYCHGMARS